MALITCPECGREKVSDTATACPDCGYGIKEHFDKIKNDPKNKIEEYVICHVCGLSGRKQTWVSNQCRVCGHNNITTVQLSSDNWRKLVTSDEYITYVQNLSVENIANKDLIESFINSKRKLFAFDKQFKNNTISNKGVSCPYCSSYNVRKIGMTGRLVSTSLFGLGSKKVGKQWHCNNCRSDF